MDLPVGYCSPLESISIFRNWIEVAYLLSHVEQFARRVITITSFDCNGVDGTFACLNTSLRVYFAKGESSCIFPMVELPALAILCHLLMFARVNITWALGSQGPNRGNGGLKTPKDIVQFSRIL